MEKEDKEKPLRERHHRNHTAEILSVNRSPFKTRDQMSDEPFRPPVIKWTQSKVSQRKAGS